jgi:dolichol-phosphate mannosyltransferase
MKISVVTPVYKAENCIEVLHERLGKELKKLTDDYEIIFVNDSSPDNSWKVIEKICSKDNKAKGINLARNFGQHHAITAGLDYAEGDWVVVMDCDLQDRPEDIKKLYLRAQEGFDVVFGQRTERKDGLLKKLSSDIFYICYNYFTDSKYDGSVANFSISRSIVIKNFRRMKEHSRSFPLFVKWMGFNIGFVEVTHSKRLEGKSSYSFHKLFNLAINSIVSQSDKPLRLAIKVGFILSSFSIIYAVFLILRHALYDVNVEGWTSLMVSIFFLSGLLLANMGVLGLYIGKIFEETKGRPIYIVRELRGIKKESGRQ